MHTPVEPDAQPLRGYRGIWYSNEVLGPPYAWKYSGGLATYPQQHAPLAIYAPAVDRTYFVFGGSINRPAKPDYLPQNSEVPGDTACCIGAFDHATGKLLTPFSWLIREVIDAHENPVLSIDPQGFLWMFCPAHGAQRPAWILRSKRPYDHTDCQLVRRFEPSSNFSYPQPWWIQPHGLILFQTFYEQRQLRRIGVAHSHDGHDWSRWDDRLVLSRIALGGYQISWPGVNGSIATAFDMHPPVDGDKPLNHRCNLYFARSSDGGVTWQSAAGHTLELPLTDPDNPALVLDTRTRGRLLYLKDIQFDAQGEPVLLYLTAVSAKPGPDAMPIHWHLSIHQGQGRWRHHTLPFDHADHAYDHGSLLILSEHDWRQLAPSRPGPYPHLTGGRLELWQSPNQGESWRLLRAIDPPCDTIPDDLAPRLHHTYVRRPLHAHRDFAWFWAAADPMTPSEVHLFFANADGHVKAMPFTADAPST